MKRSIQRNKYNRFFCMSCFWCILLCFWGHLGAFGVGTFILPRSQTVNAARELVAWQREINTPHDCNNYWSLSLAFEYDRGLYMNRVVDYLFGSNMMTVVGSAYQPCVPSCGTTVLADYFGLPRDFKSTVIIRPSLANFLVDFDFYYGMNALCQGLYARLHLPLVYANWDLNLCEAVSVCGTYTYPAGYMAATDVPRDDLPCSFKQAMQGTTTFGDMKRPLTYGKIFDRQTAVHVADVQAVVGYNLILCNTAHAGVNLRFSAPTGTKNCQEFLFEPVIGNGHHWEVGIGFTGHYDVWSDETRSAVIGLYIDSNITHLFTAHLKRSYNFTHNGPGSRYMLLENMQKTSDDLFFSDGSLSSDQYTGVLMPAINETTLCSKIRIPVQIDSVFKAAISWHNFTVDIGYNVWFRSSERLVCRQRFPDNHFAFKGDAQLYGFTNATEQAIALAATQESALLCGGQGSGNADFTNANADNAVGAFSEGITTLTNLTAADAFLIGVPQLPVLTSRPSIVLSDTEISNCSGLVPHAISQKGFVHINYTWKTDDATTPYLGLGADIEYTHGSLCTNSGLPLWGIWITGGFSR